MTSAAAYVAGDEGRYYYPELGDPLPPGGADVHLLNTGDGICVRGKWDPTRFNAWAPLPLRDRAREKLLNPPAYHRSNPHHQE